MKCDSMAKEHIQVYAYSIISIDEAMIIFSVSSRQADILVIEKR